MSLRDELKEIGQDTVKQAVPIIVGGATAGMIAWLRKMPERMAARQARREKRRAARRARRAARKQYLS